MKESTWFLFENERDPEDRLPVYIRLGRDRSGKHVCTGLIVGDLREYSWLPRPVSSNELRRIQLPELVRGALAMGGIPDEYGDAVAGMLEAAPLTHHPGRAGYDDAHFVRIAELYRKALDVAPNKPTDLLATQLHASKPTVRRWLAEARRRGHLGKTTRGRAGEERE